MTFSRSGAAATGLATLAPQDRVLDVWYPAPELVDAADAGTQPGADADLDALAGSDEVRRTRALVVRTTIGALADPPADAYDVWLRLHLLSHRLVRPNEQNLDGIFGDLLGALGIKVGDRGTLQKEVKITFEEAAFGGAAGTW